MRHDLTDFITRLEVTIDYPEEDLEDITVPDVAGAIRKQLTALDDMLEASHDGRIIRDGVMAAIAGTPNAGKSSCSTACSRKTGPSSPMCRGRRGMSWKNGFPSKASRSASSIRQVSGKQTIPSKR